MEFNGILVVSYIIATILFILALGGLSNQETARRGNWYGIIGMTIALLATVFGGDVTANYDKLIVEIWTDGRLGPEDALTMSAAILRHHLDVFVNYDKTLVEFEEEEKQVDTEFEEMRRKLTMSVNEIELSVRAANCLNNANITTVGQLAMKSEQEMLKYRNFGKKSLNEIKDKLTSLGLGLGMSFDAELVEPAKPQQEAV